MNEYSKHDLIGQELEVEEETSAWKKFLSDLSKRKTLTLSVDVPALLFLRCRSLVRIIDDSEFEHEVSDVFEILISQWKQQFAATVDPARMAGSLRALEEKTINYYTGERSILRRDAGRKKIAKVSVKYEELLDLEFICESLTCGYNEEGVTFTVEGVLSALFVDFMRRVERGDVKNLAKILSSHAREGAVV
jgi:hypothetical protein